MQYFHSPGLWIAGLSLLVMTAQRSAAAAEDAQQIFDSLYGAKVKQVAASIDRADDIALAKDLVTVARTSTDTPGLLDLLCETAYELGMKHGDGYATSTQAMSLIIEHIESKRSAAREKLVTVLARQATTGKADEREAANEQLIDTLLILGDEKLGAKKWTDSAGDYRRALTIATPRKSPRLDEIKAKLEDASRRDRAEKQKARLEEKLLKDANDFATAEDIVRLCVVELDDPAAGLKYLGRIQDANLKTLTPKAAEPVDSQTPESSLSLAQWYRTLASQVTGTATRIPLQRSSAYLSLALTSDQISDLQRKKAEIILKEVETDLAKLPGLGKSSSTVAKTTGFNTAVWAVRVWNGDTWGPKPLTTIETAVQDKMLVTKNTDGTHNRIHLCHMQTFASDFEIDIELIGGGEIGLGSADGADVNYHIRVPKAGLQPQQVRISRKGKEITFAVAGKTVAHEPSIRDDPSMKCYFFIAIERDAQATIRKFKMTGK